MSLTADLADARGLRAADRPVPSGELGRLDVLVNCAGMNRRKPIDAVSGDDYDTIMAVNLRSVYFLSRRRRT